MSSLIKIVRNQHRIEFDEGRFDGFCVYLQPNGQSRYSPSDTQYFEFFKRMAAKYGAQRIYDDFVKIYTPTTSVTNPNVLNLITEISDTYENNVVEMDVWLTLIYAGMIAEENKTNTILKKRMKRLGMYQVLIEGMEPSIAASFSKGKKWRELDALMKEKGF